MIEPKFKINDKVEWDTPNGVVTGTILELFDKTETKNTHLSESSYLISCSQIDFPFTAPYSTDSIRPAKETSNV